jgi:hypothetical protein
MKYTVAGFQQPELLKLGFDLNDAYILRWIVEFMHSPKMCNKVVGNEIYFWVKYQAVIDDIPIMGITNPEMIARRLAKWEKIGFAKKLLVKGKDEHICNGRAGVRNGTFTYFTLNQGMMEPLRALPESRPLENTGERVYSKVEPSSTGKSKGGLPKSRTKDSLVIDPLIINNPIRDKNLTQKYFDWDEYEFLSTGFARNKTTGKEYSVKKFPIRLPLDICRKIDEYYNTILKD